MATLDEATTEALRKILPSAGSVANPVDVLGDAGGELYGKAAELLLQSDSVDGLIVILTPQTMTEVEKTAQVVVEVCRKYSKPVFACFMGAILSKRE
jgi:acetyltransferase